MSLVIAEYVYRDEQGGPLRRKLRYDPKSFAWERWTGSSWAPGLEGARPNTLYGLERLHRQRTTWIVEGERDVETLTQLGIPAATSGAAGSWTDAHAQQLKAAGVEQVIVVPDHDPAGEQHGVDTMRSCLRAGITV